MSLKMPDGWQPSSEEQRTMLHILSALGREVEVLDQDGMETRAIVVGLLVSAIKLAATSKAVQPSELRGMVAAIVKRYTEEGHEA
jgi:hypothetical protein